MKLKFAHVLPCAVIVVASGLPALAQQAQSPAYLSIVAAAAHNQPAQPTQTVAQAQDQAGSFAASQMKPETIGGEISFTVSIERRQDVYHAQLSEDRKSAEFVRLMDGPGSEVKIKAHIPSVGINPDYTFHANPSFPATMMSDGKSIWITVPVGDHQSLQADLELNTSANAYSFTGNAQADLERYQSEDISNALKAFVDEYASVYEAHGYKLDINNIVVTDSRSPSDPNQCGMLTQSAPAVGGWTMTYLPYTITASITPQKM